MKIGIISDSLKLGARAGIAKAAELCADGVQIYAVAGEICPENLDTPERKQLKDYCNGLGLEISALCGDLGGHGFLREEENGAKIKKSKEIIDLAVDLGTNVVTTHIGVVPDDVDSGEYKTLLSACRVIGDYAFDKNVSFAIETGPERAIHLKEFLDDAGSKGLSVNLDPANLVMVTGDDPVQAVYTLKDYIVHTHAKDGIKLKECSAIEVYNSFAEGGVEGLNIGELFAEVPLGEGAVDFDSYLSALRDIGYSGYLTIERETGDDPADDIAAAVEFLHDKLSRTEQYIFQSQFKHLYDEDRWMVECGRYEHLEALAVDELQSAVQCRLPYVLEVQVASATKAKKGQHRILIGTPENHPGIAALTAGPLTVPAQAQGYGIWTGPDPDMPTQRCVAIAGRDAAGVLYGVQHFNASFLGLHVPPDVPDIFRQGSPQLDNWTACEWPRLATRGIWTWGYPVYDYQRFIDNMVRLRLNSLTLWNDAPPLNAASIIEYAHAHGIRVIFGFHWGWGQKLDISQPDVVDKIRDHVLSTYADGYAHLNHDGIYFQTLTETLDTQLNNQPLLAHACKMVNTVGRALLEDHPELKIQFGLHAISVGDHVELVDMLDNQIDVVWEDAGAIPFNLEPVANISETCNQAFPEGISDSRQTQVYALRLQAARPHMPFYMVVKGHRGLRWGQEFENHGPFVLGRQTPRWIRQRIEERRGLRNRRWSQWLRNYPIARDLYHALICAAQTDMGAWILVEDDGFEFDIAPDVALHAALLWNPDNPSITYTDYAVSHYWEQLKLS